MKSTGMTIEVADGLVEPIIRGHIQTAIVRELEKDKDLVPKLVKAALVQKVDHKGERSRSSYDNKYLYIDMLCKKAIQDAAKMAMREYIAENQELLKEEVKRQISKQKGKMAEAFVDGLITAMNARFAFSIKVDIED